MTDEDRPRRRAGDFHDIESEAALIAELRLAASEGRSIRRAMRELISFSTKRRRLTVVLAVFLVWFAIHAHEVSRNACGAHKFGLDVQMAPQTIAACDVFWPESSTDPHQPWPSTFNKIGMGVQAAGLGALVIWYRRARDVTVDFPEVTEREMFDRGYEH